MKGFHLWHKLQECQQREAAIQAAPGCQTIYTEWKWCATFSWILLQSCFGQRPRLMRCWFFWALPTQTTYYYVPLEQFPWWQVTSYSVNLVSNLHWIICNSALQWANLLGHGEAEIVLFENFSWSILTTAVYFCGNSMENTALVHGNESSIQQRHSSLRRHRRASECSGREWCATSTEGSFVWHDFQLCCNCVANGCGPTLCSVKSDYL